MLGKEQLFEIEEYEKKTEFASFLPGINGWKGIPVWSFYVNRGQCMSSFGTMDKEHSIMEFYPAHQAYQRTQNMGFRTFLKIDGACQEAFTSQKNRKRMLIGKNELRIEEEDKEHKLRISVCYTTLPEEPLGALVREVEIKNLSGHAQKIEILDGMPELIPYGVSLASMKDMAQTAKAWMEVQDHEKCVPRFKVRASMKDTAVVSKVEDFHFAMAESEGELLPVIVEKEVLFGYDTALQTPLRFEKESAKTLSMKKQMTQNTLPCCFFAKEVILENGASIRLQELYGMGHETKELEDLVEKALTPGFFEEKQMRARTLAEELTDAIATKTGHPIFDEYCRQSYLDNVLRGGNPIKLGKHVFYLYSRKHGDLERDYNSFFMYPESFSQGNGNFRDVNQNRRCDVQFAPFVGKKNIKDFYSCLQTNGYNPLGIEKAVFRLPAGKYEEFIEGDFTPGRLYEALGSRTKSETEREQLFQKIMNDAEPLNKTNFLEGYWTDHWTYSLDLVESYLTVYPEQEEDLLFEDGDYTWRTSAAAILPRRKRYEKMPQGIRQYHFLKERADQGGCVLNEKKEIVYATLAEKLFALCVLKTAALDPYGMGIEMEGGKPGWYDALNGLPGLLGSSMAETCELERHFDFLLTALRKYQASISVPGELYLLAQRMTKIIEQEEKEWQSEGANLSCWNAVNDWKEQYWADTEDGFHKKKVMLTAEEAETILSVLRREIACGIQKAVRFGKGLMPTYFAYEVTTWEEQDGICPTGFQIKAVPDFLEGPVHAMKLKWPYEEKKRLYETVKDSTLYDEKLQMYKVNKSLKEATFELGRAKAFTPGWLENESIWLHMEYKYLLELLKNGMYEEFEEDFGHAAVPFLKEETYGRSLLENSSFIASSENPDSRIHGKGFVARLSGSTAEFLQIWQTMMFGKSPFIWEKNELCMKLTPFIPKNLIGEDAGLEARFLGSVSVRYHLPDRETVSPKNSRASVYHIRWSDGTEETCGEIRGSQAEAVRQGKAEAIEVQMERI